MDIALSTPTPWYWDKVNLFDQVPDDGRQAFLQRSERREFRRGEHIFRAPDRATRVYFLESGLVKIYTLSPRGAVTIFWFCVPGDLFGAGGISGAAQQSVYAQTSERSTIFSLSRAGFEQIVQEYPRLGLNVIRLLSARLRLACDAMTDTGSQLSEARLARVLLRLAQNWGEETREGLRFRVQVSHQELGNMIGATRQTVNRGLRNFVRHGWLVQDKRSLVVRDREGLTAFLQKAEREDATEPYRPG